MQVQAKLKDLIVYFRSVLGVVIILVNLINQQKFNNYWKFLIIVSIIEVYLFNAFLSLSGFNL